MNGLAMAAHVSCARSRGGTFRRVLSDSEERIGMRALLFGVALTSLALALAATATGNPESQAQTGSCAKANLNLVRDGRLTLGTDNPAFPPWWGGGETRKPWKVSNPYSGR